MQLMAPAREELQNSASTQEQELANALALVDSLRAESQANAAAVKADDDKEKDEEVKAKLEEIRF